MANMIQYFYGTQAAYDTLQSKVEDALYFITDTERIYKGSNIVAANNIKVVTEMPDTSDAIENMLYIHAEDEPAKTSIKILNSGKTDFVTIASSDSLITASSVTEFTNKTIDADENVISNLGVDNFNPDAVSTAIPAYNSENHTGTGVDTKFVTEKAITDALADTIISVEYTAPEGESGPVLLFKSKNGIEKTINIPRDNFLSNANLNEGTKELELTMVSGNVIKIPVSDLMVAELDSDHIKLAENVDVMGSNWGSWKNGDTMTEGMTLTEILKKGVATQVPPKYTQPTISIANNSGTAPGNYEAGTTINAKFRSTFNKNDAGDLTAHQVYKNNAAVGESSTTTPITYEESFVLGDSTVSFTSKASYNEGAIKDDNLGDPYPTGHIAAGTKTSSALNFVGKRYGFYGASANEITADSASIRALTKTALGLANGNTFNVTVPVGARYVLFAYPATLRSCTQIMYVETNDTGMKPNFDESQVQVADARGGSAGLTNYRVFKYSMAGAAEATMTFKVTI